MLENFKTKLDYGKAIFICDDDIRLSSYEAEIRPKLMILKSEPDKVYGLDTYEFTREFKSEIFRKAEENGLKIINITEVIREKIRNIVEKELQKYMSEKEIGIGEFYPVPLHLQKVFNYLGYREGSLPVAEKICSRALCLPIFPELKDEEVSYIIDTIKAFYK